MMYHKRDKRLFDYKPFKPHEIDHPFRPQAKLWICQNDSHLYLVTKCHRHIHVFLNVTTQETRVAARKKIYLHAPTVDRQTCAMTHVKRRISIRWSIKATRPRNYGAYVVTWLDRSRLRVLKIKKKKKQERRGASYETLSSGLKWSYLGGQSYASNGFAKGRHDLWPNSTWHRRWRSELCFIFPPLYLCS